ncbi:hypothetical protein SUDANB66_02701 [Streptomyces sp. SudanB66_2053]
MCAATVPRMTDTSGDDRGDFPDFPSFVGDLRL